MPLLDLAEDAFKVACKHCADGVAVRYRPETDEYVHDMRWGILISHTICRANNLRKAAKELGNGRPQVSD